jgi:DNA-binding transcriptional LysR family regulator
MHRMDWDDVRLILALFETGNFYDAAKQLRVDRSTVSRRLTSLERQWGTALFVRTQAGLRATAAAERMRPFAERMAREAAGLKQAALSTDGPVAGEVRLATTEAMASLLIERGLLSLRNQHPKLVIELLSGNKPLDMLRGDADLALRVLPARHASLRVRCVARFKVGLFAAHSYVEKRGRPTTPSALSGHDVILPGGELAALPDARWLAATPGIRIVFRTNSVPGLVSAAALGMGVVPLTAALGNLDPRLERLQILDDLPARTLWLVTPQAGGTRAAVRLVADHVAAIFKSL